MNIDILIKKFDAEFEEISVKKSRLNQNSDAQYWLLLGQSETLGNSIVDIIEEYAKNNILTEFQEKHLRI